MSKSSLSYPCSISICGARVIQTQVIEKPYPIYCEITCRMSARTRSPLRSSAGKGRCAGNQSGSAVGDRTEVCLWSDGEGIVMPTSFPRKWYQSL